MILASSIQDLGKTGYKLHVILSIQVFVMMEPAAYLECSCMNSFLYERQCQEQERLSYIKGPLSSLDLQGTRASLHRSCSVAIYCST